MHFNAHVNMTGGVHFNIENAQMRKAMNDFVHLPQWNAKGFIIEWNVVNQVYFWNTRKVFQN